MAPTHENTITMCEYYKFRRSVAVATTAIGKEGLRIATTTSLSLRLPISFLFLARHIASVHISTSSSPSSSLFTRTTFSVTILAFFTSVFSFGALAHGLTSINGSRFTFIVTSQCRRFNTAAAWVLLFLIEVSCLYLGRSQRHTVNPNIYEYNTNSAFLWKLVMFLGLHETMVLWWSMVARVVDEAVYGFYIGEEDHDMIKWVEKVVLGVCYGCLWWCRVRDEAEAMALGDVVVGWWLYYLTAAIGVVKVLRGLVWLSMRVWRCFKLAYKRSKCNNHPTLV